MRNYQWHIICLLITLCSRFSAAQTVQTITYTTKEGLPSNSVYRTVTDTKGFLWVATENGLARFDGRKFYTYTTAKGLTDNEIIDLVTDSSKTLWAIPFRRSPCYYNPLTDRFENEHTDPELGKIDLANTHKVHLLQYGGIAFSNNLRHFYIFKNGKTTAHKEIIGREAGLIQKIVEYAPDRYIFLCEDSIRFFSNGKMEKPAALGKKLIAAEYSNGTAWLIQEKNIAVLSITQTGEWRQTAEKQFPFVLRIFCNTGKHFAITSLSGNTYILDRKTLEIKDNIFTGTHVRFVLEDAGGNTWLSTMENGLIKMQQKRISSFTGLPEMLRNFNTLLKTDQIYAGASSGEVYVYDGLYDARPLGLTKDMNIDAWVRKIIKIPDGIYVATQTSSFLFGKDFRKPLVTFAGRNNRSSKTVVLLNDSLLGMGSHAYAYLYHLKRGQFTDSIAKRVISMAADQNGNLYIGSNDGLYLWQQDSLIALSAQYPVLQYRVNSMACTSDNLIWVGLGSDSLLVLQNNRLLASLPLGGIIPGNICKSLFSRKAGEVWLGTNKGLNKIQYSIEKGRFLYNNTYFGTSDGLIGEQVNDISISNDTVYVATSAGISYLPENLSLPVSDIATHITRIQINGKDEILQDNYRLRHDKNDISIEFSGVDLTGFIPLFEYRTNNSSWQPAEKIELKRLSPGRYTINIRAIKRDGKPSRQEAVLYLTIQTPFWQNPLYRLAAAVVLLGLLLYVIQRRYRKRQQAAIEKLYMEKRMTELEMQALKAQINPHFVFNCLNSIKGFIYEKEYLQADRYLDKFSELLRRTMDNAEASIISLADEFSYLDTYLQLEKLRFAGKFDYSIQTEQGLNSDACYVPAMLLQPYVENAIRHGVRHLENQKGMIRISACMSGTMLLIEIDDNGIGREKAGRLRSGKQIEYQSRGMQLSRRRAELFGILQEVVDKKDTSGNGCGTTIRLTMPVNLKS